MKVKLFKIVNSLRMKLGRSSADKRPGFIAEEAIAEADGLIESLCKDCTITIGRNLEKLIELWSVMRDMEKSQERGDIAREMFTYAHEIKDISSMCGYELIAYFAESLRDYVEKTELSLDAQRVIIQAHLDAIQVTHHHDVKKDDGSVADELKKAVKIAVDKYS